MQHDPEKTKSFSGKTTYWMWFSACVFPLLFTRLGVSICIFRGYSAYKVGRGKEWAIRNAWKKPF